MIHVPLSNDHVIKVFNIPFISDNVSAIFDYTLRIQHGKDKDYVYIDREGKSKG